MVRSSPSWTSGPPSQNTSLRSGTLRDDSDRSLSARPSGEGRIAALLRVRRVPTRQRLILSLLLGCVAGVMTARESARVPGPRDFGPVWFAARSILQGVDPYPLVGPGLAYDWSSPLVYPITAAFVAIPFTPFPQS